MGWIAISTMAVALAAAGAWLVVLLRRARDVRRRFDVLGEIAAVSDGAGSLEESLEAICGVLVPAFADICAIDVIEGDVPRRAALRVAPGGPPGVEEGLLRRQPSIPERMLDGEGEGAMRPRFFERLAESDLLRYAEDDADFAFLRRIAVRSVITVGLKARGRVMGVLTVSVGWSGRRYDEEDVRFARVLSGRVALALDNSGLFVDLERSEAARAKIAETLQHGLLPPPLPHIPGWSLAAFYRPAGAENEVGGDFYDAFPVSDGWFVVVGDVAGRGARAASVTALARYTLRTAAVLTNDVLVALATLNRALLARQDASLCSIAALALPDDPTRPVRIAVAGHPPPLLVDGTSVGEAVGVDPVLGAFGDAEWKVGEVRIEVGQQLVVVTDGVTDACGEVERFGEDRLRDRLAGAGNPADAVQRIERALLEFTAGSLEDDAAILALARAEDVGPEPLGLAVGGGAAAQ